MLLASLCQWSAGPAGGDPGTVGMGVPAPLSWEAVQQAGLPAPGGDSGIASQRLHPRVVAATSGSWLLLAGRQVLSIGGQERLLWWGRLLLEGG